MSVHVSRLYIKIKINTKIFTYIIINIYIREYVSLCRDSGTSVFLYASVCTYLCMIVHVCKGTYMYAHCM